jgi:hypothetical protein
VEERGGGNRAGKQQVPLALRLFGMTKVVWELAGQFAQEFLFVHAVLEGFAAVDEDDGDFVGELAADLGVGVHIDFAPGETSAAGKLGEAFFDDLAKMASLAGVDHDGAGIGHAGILALWGADFHTKKGQGRRGQKRLAKCPLALL